MAAKFRLNDRVEHEYLGTAVVTRVFAGGIGYLIRTDVAPHVRYNGGDHNCLAWPHEMKLVERPSLVGDRSI